MTELYSIVRFTVIVLNLRFKEIGIKSIVADDTGVYFLFDKNKETRLYLPSNTHRFHLVIIGCLKRGVTAV